MEVGAWPDRIRGKLVTTFRYPIRVDVRQPKFEWSASLAYIDVAKLARAARAEFEVGHFEGGLLPEDGSGGRPQGNGDGPSC